MARDGRKQTILSAISPAASHSCEDEVGFKAYLQRRAKHNPLLPLDLQSLEYKSLAETSQTNILSNPEFSTLPEFLMQDKAA